MDKYLDPLKGVEDSMVSGIEHVSRITIDLISNTMFDIESYLDDNCLDDVSLGMMIYEIEVLLEVFDPRLSCDISLLRMFNNVLEQWKSDLGFLSDVEELVFGKKGEI